MTIRSILYCLAVVLLAVFPARGKPTRKIRVTFNRTCEAVPARMVLVINGNEKILTRLDRAGTSQTWTATREGKTFDAEHSTGSLRLGRARTDCRESSAEEDPADRNGPSVAVFVFDCNVLPASDVDVLVAPDTIPVRYERSLARDTLESSRPCSEAGEVSSSAPTIYDVRLPKEKLRLQIGDLAPAGAPGVPLRLSKRLHLDRKTLLGYQNKLRVQGELSAPNVSPNAIDIDARSIEKTGFQTLDVTVK